MINVTAELDGYKETINGLTSHITGSITQGVGSAIDSFSFSIYPDNPGYNLITSRKTRIKAVNDKTGRTEFNGRVLLLPVKMDNNGIISKSVTCESLLGVLCDSIQPYAEEATMSLNDFIDLVLTNHNNRVEQSKRITRGTVNVQVAGTGNVTKGLQYQNTYETLKTKLVDVYGGDLQVIEDSNGNLKLNYLQEIGTVRTTEIKLGKNMKDAERTISPLEIITRVIPLGSKLKTTETDAEGNETEIETEERLTLTGYTPPGKPTMTHPWIDDDEKTQTLGIVCGILDFNDVTQQDNLYSKAMEYMTNQNRAVLSHKITALDLKEIGEDIDGFACGDSYPLKNPLIGLDDTLRIIQKTIDINSPYNSSLTFGDKTSMLSELTAQKNADSNVVIEEIKKNIQDLSNKTERTNTSITTLGGSVTESVEAYILERWKDIVTTSDLEKLEERISYKSTESADGLRQDFTTLINSIKTDADGNLSSEFEELKGYIRYYQENGQPFIELGKNTSDLIVRITNDRISFNENGIEVAYISENQLYVTDGNFIRSITIGNFAFIPRDNGNLSLIRRK